MSDCAFEKDIIVNEAFCDAVIDDPELEIVIRNLIITAIEMYTAQFYEEPDNPDKFHENTKDFKKKYWSVILTCSAVFAMNRSDLTKC